VWNEEVFIAPAAIDTQSRIKTNLYFTNKDSDGYGSNTWIVEPTKKKRIAILTPVGKDSNGNPELLYDSRFEFNVAGYLGASIKNVRIKLNLWIYITNNYLLSLSNTKVKYTLRG
jgi:hypothetical protein